MARPWPSSVSLFPAGARQESSAQLQASRHQPESSQPSRLSEPQACEPPPPAKQQGEAAALGAGMQAQAQSTQPVEKQPLHNHSAARASVAEAVSEEAAAHLAVPEQLGTAAVGSKSAHAAAVMEAAAQPNTQRQPHMQEAEQAGSPEPDQELSKQVNTCPELLLHIVCAHGHLWSKLALTNILPPGPGCVGPHAWILHDSSHAMQQLILQSLSFQPVLPPCVISTLA